MRCFAVLVTLLPLASGFHLSALAPRRAPAAVGVRMGFFDQLKKSFDNQDYSQSPATYEQTNARASHVLVASEEEALKIKQEIADGLRARHLSSAVCLTLIDGSSRVP